MTQFLLDHPAASLALSNVISEASRRQPVEMYFFYSHGEPPTRAKHHYLGDTIGIFVWDGDASSDQCISILYEVLNTKGEKRFKQLFDLARSGGIAKKDFPREMLRQEFQAVRETKTLLKGFDLTPDEAAASRAYKHFSEAADDFDGFLKQSRKISEGRDEKYYEDLYDRIGRTKD